MKAAIWLAAFGLAVAGSLPGQELIAHRGLSARAPENTLAAFNMAWQEDADGCELDLYLTSDGKIIVLHDKDTTRTTGVTHTPSATTAAELTALDAGTWKDPKWTGERIPTLAESLATLPEGKKRFFLEVKCGPEVIPYLAKELETWRERASQVAIISFNRQVCADAKRAMPWLQVYQLAGGKTKEKEPRTDIDEVIRQAKEDRLDGLNLGREWPWNEAFVKMIRDAGLGVYVWTVNSPEEARKLARLGVDGITTDDTTAIRRALSDSAATEK